MNRIRCGSCRRTVAVSSSPSSQRTKIFCDEWCASEPAATPTEARTDQWRALVAYGVSPVAIGKMYGVAHSQVYKAVAA